MNRAFECSVCLEVFTAPMTTRCGHSFCSECVRRVRRCPLCEKHVRYEECVPNYQLQDGVEAAHPEKRGVVFDHVDAAAPKPAVQREDWQLRLLRMVDDRNGAEGEQRIEFDNHRSLEDMTSIQRMLDGGLPLESRDYRGRTLLLRSIGFRPFDGRLVRELLTRGADASAIDDHGNTAMHLAASRTRADVVPLFLGVHPIDTLNADGNTALCCAVNSSTLRIVRWLLANGASPLVGHPLHIATRRVTFDYCEVFLATTNVDARDDDERTPLMLAARTGNERVVRGLIDAGASFVARDHLNRNLFHSFFHPAGDTLATVPWNSLLPDKFHGVHRPRVLPTLLAHPRAPEIINDVDDYGHTALALAVCCARTPEIVRMLLAAGARHDVADRDGRTPLHLAAKLGQKQALRLLLEAGADADFVDGAGRTPRDYAAADSLKRMFP